MFEQILDLCRVGISSAVSWFAHFADKIGFVSALLGLFLLYSVVRFLIIPLIGAGMAGFSDVAHSTFKNPNKRDVIIKERKRKGRRK